MFARIITLLLLSTNFATVEAAPQRASGLVVTASSVEVLHHDLSSVHPPILDTGDLAPEVYTKEMTCLGYYGPLGPYGPLGVTGPVGTNLWNPSFWISAVADWSRWTDVNHGPLSSEGPLGHTGPLNPYAYWVTLPSINDFGKQLQVGGVWSVLGPCGPLGALGPLGPLGPVGAHGYDTDSKGNYVHFGKVQRSIQVDWDGTGNDMRTYWLYEQYDDSFARTFANNDASFMVAGHLSDTGDTAFYPFSSPEDQYVTVVVLPEYSKMVYTQAMVVLSYAALIDYDSTFAPSAVGTFDNFDISVLDASSGQVLAKSSSETLVDAIEIEVKAGRPLKVKVSLKSSWHFGQKYFRVLVTGSTKHINGTDITGSHQLLL